MTEPPSTGTSSGIGPLTGRPTRELPKRRAFSLAGKVTALFTGLLVLISALASLANHLDWPPLVTFLTILLVGLPLGAWSVQTLLKPLDKVIRGVSDGIRSFRDRDFGVRLAYRRDDELGELVALYNQVGEILREERLAVRQREVLLQTALDRSPAAIVLHNALDRVIYSNREARRLLTGGARLEGMEFETLRSSLPEEMRSMLDGEADGLFSLSERDPPETYFLSQRLFRLNRQRHRLILMRTMTGDLGRQEAAAWKKVIRVIGHELNNSLAPVSSLIHSAQVIAREPRHAARSEEVFRLIRERLDHLQDFIEGYARFARLPEPRKQASDWGELVRSVGEFPTLQIIGDLPQEPGHFDPAQMRQVLINLFKNAVEASEPGAPVELRITSLRDSGTYLQVRDRGIGMDSETMEKALLPFYSTKQSGSGLGLPLCREIIEAHGGKISLQAAESPGMIVTCWLPNGNENTLQESARAADQPSNAGDPGRSNATLEG